MWRLLPRCSSHISAEGLSDMMARPEERKTRRVTKRRVKKRKKMRELGGGGGGGAVPSDSLQGNLIIVWKGGRCLSTGAREWDEQIRGRGALGD